MLFRYTRIKRSFVQSHSAQRSDTRANKRLFPTPALLLGIFTQVPCSTHQLRPGTVNICADLFWDCLCCTELPVPGQGKCAQPETDEEPAQWEALEELRSHSDTAPGLPLSLEHRKGSWASPGTKLGVTSSRPHSSPQKRMLAAFLGLSSSFLECCGCKRPFDDAVPALREGNHSSWVTRKFFKQSRLFFF